MSAHVHCDTAWLSFLYTLPSPHPNLCDPVLVCISFDSQDAMIASFHVSMVCLPNSYGRTVVILQGETSLRGREFGKRERLREGGK